MAQRKTKTETRRFRALLLALLSIAGILAIAGNPIRSNPLVYLQVGDALLSILSPVALLAVTLQGVFRYLPVLLFPLMALVLLLPGLRLLFKGKPVLAAAGILLLAASVAFASVAVLLILRKPLPAGDVEQWFSALASLVSLPGALLYHWFYRIFGPMAYPLPIYLLALAAALLPGRPSKREEIAVKSSVLFGILLLGTMAVTFFIPHRGSFLLRDYILRFIPSLLGGALFSLLFLLSLLGGISLFTGISLKKWFSRRQSKGSSRADRTGARRSPDSRPEAQQGPGEKKFGHGDQDVKRDDGKEEQAEHGGEKRAIALNLSPIPEEKLLSLPQAEESSEEREADTTGEDETGVKEQEISAAEEEATALLNKLSLPLSFSGAVKGPSSILLSYTVPPSISIGEVKKQEKEISFRLSERQGSPLIPIPGREEIGILLPRRERQMLPFSAGASLLAGSDGNLPVYLGKSIYGNDLAIDLTKLPHLLVAGSTGSGKSVFLHVLIESVIRGPRAFRTRIILADPKRVEFFPYRKSANLACPIVEEGEDILQVLEMLVRTMEERYAYMAEEEARNIGELHERGIEMPFIVAIIDELSDLFMGSAGKGIRDAVVRLGQKSRATGIHLVLATQRPSADIVDGLIKANFPARIAFRTSSQVDSRVILDQPGAEQLLGKGDGLYISPEESRAIRFQGAYVEAPQ